MSGSDVQLRYAFGKVDYLPLSLVETLVEAISWGLDERGGSPSKGWEIPSRGVIVELSLICKAFN